MTCSCAVNLMADVVTSAARNLYALVLIEIIEQFYDESTR